MRFSLKDLMWSVMFASVGLACLVTEHKLRFGEASQLGAALAILSGGLLGAALGRLFGDAVEKIVAGLVLGLVWWTIKRAAG